MALYADRVKQSLGVTGTGTVTLTLATTGNGYQSFLTAFGTGTQTVAYCIADQSGPNWEVGTGSYNGSANTLARTTVLASSNGGSLTNFSGGTQDVFCTAPAKYLDTFSSTNQGVVPASGGGTANFLRADGSFAAPPATAPAGSTTQIQYNNAGAFGADANFTFTSGTNTLTTGNITGSGTTSMVIQSKAPALGSSPTLTIQTPNSPSTSYTPANLILKAGSRFGSGVQKGGDVNINAGNGGALNGGDVNITAGSGDPFGGSINLTPGAFFSVNVNGDFNAASGSASVYVFADDGSTGASAIGMSSNNLGFYGTFPISKPDVNGSRATGAALVSLLSALASLGLITDSTTV